jgi:acyl-CoA reductase-like NAD-dependent aldehyde dehydrogenase
MNAKIVSTNPANGEILASLDPTPIERLPEVFKRAQDAQRLWAARSLKERADFLIQLREVIINHIDPLTALISKENGKPHFEALTSELIPSLDMLTFYARKAPRVLADRPIKLELMRHRKSVLNHWPLGVVAIISPWNFPFLLPFGEIIMAVVAGNAVVFKPSEVTPLIGLKIQELFEEAGAPLGLLQTVVGDGKLGAALIQEKPAKIFFTGSVATGKKIMAAAANHLIPVNLELGGKDPMIVLADADLDYATSAALWGGFMNSGQVCASTERLIVHESIAQPFTELLVGKMKSLRQAPGKPEDADLGAITYEAQKKLYISQIEDAKRQGATILSGGSFNTNQTALEPTLVSGPNIEKLDIYNEETFGPVIALTTFKSIEEAIEKANRSRYGLLASVITRDHKLGEQIARRLEAGSVLINEVAYTAGIGETPWGGLKESGFGRTHSEAGLLEFVHLRHIHLPRTSLSVFKSPWWYPYTPYQYLSFRSLVELYRRSWLKKAVSAPNFIWNFTQFLKNEKRL